jgi:hypothetical protein
LALETERQVRKFLYLFEQDNPNDKRPRSALDGLLSWSKGELSVPEVRKLAFASHSAARDSSSPASMAIARACGHTAAIAHVITHAPHALKYLEKAKKTIRPKESEVVRGYTIKYHANGKTIWSKGKIKNGKPDGYWEWYRIDGTLKPFWKF